MPDFIPIWAIIAGVLFVLCAIAVALDTLQQRRSQAKHNLWLRSWRMPDDVLSASGYYRWDSEWPRVIKIKAHGGESLIFYMKDMRKRRSFVPDTDTLVTLFYRPADPRSNRHAELWWADYGIHIAPNEAVQAAERILNPPQH